MKQTTVSQILLMVAIGMAVGLSLQPLVSDDSSRLQFQKFNDFLNLVKRNYIEEQDIGNLVESSITGMLGELDPHSVYIPPSAKQKSDEEFRGNFEGIGVQFRVISDTITVIVPIIGGPSEKAGLRCNDKIVRINGESAVGLKQDDIPKKLKGPTGSTVEISVRREGVPELLTLQVERGRVPILSVDGAFMIQDTDIGYIYVNRFAATTHREVLAAARRLLAAGAKKIVLDLRWNGGGYLEQAYRIADEFVPDGHKIVYRRGRFEQFNEDYYSSDGGELESIPLTVLINAGSASASEIVSGAIQDLDRGLIVGETSFGKGLVQQQYDLPDGSAFRLTTSKYYTPSGRLIQRDYSDKTKYYALEGRVTPEEGENLMHESELDSSRPVFRTLSGRTVYGGGGIVPDYIVKDDTVPSFRRSLIDKNVFGEFVEQYVLSHGNTIRDKSQRDLLVYMRDFTVTAEMMQDFRTLAEKKGVEWKLVASTVDDNKIRLTIKALIASYIFNTGNSFVQAVIRTNQVEKAVEMFPEAIKIARLK